MSTPNSDTCLKDGTFLITFIPSLFCLFVVIWMTISSTIKLRNKTEKQIRLSIKMIYYISCIFSIIIIILQSISMCILCNKAIFSAIYYQLAYFSTILYSGLLYTIWIMLSLRIYYTFKNSAFKMSKCETYTVLILLGICIINSIFQYIHMGYWYLILHTRDFPGIYKLVHTSSTLIGVISYSFGTIFGIYIFAHKMYKLGQLIGANMDHTHQREMKLLNTTSKYIALLSIAMLTTWLSFLIYMILIFSFAEWTVFLMQMYQLQFSIDCMVNVLCLFLQYPFNKKYYNKHCRCFGNFWLFMLKTNNRNEQSRIDEELVNTELKLNMDTTSNIEIQPIERDSD